MDLAKTLAMLGLDPPAENDGISTSGARRSPACSVIRWTRTAARAHLATSVYLQMALRPHIIDVVGHTEADHAATAL